MALLPRNPQYMTGDELRREFERLMSYPKEWVALAYLQDWAHQYRQRLPSDLIS